MRLSEREVQVLRRLADAGPAGVRREQLERDIWGFAPTVRSEAVPVAMRRLRAKLEADPSEPINLRTVRGEGWTLEVRTHLEAASLPLLPMPRDALVGRGELVESLVTALQGGAGLVTLWGPGGVGKTRLSLEIARGWKRGGRGALFCDLSSCDGADRLVELLAQALCVRGDGARSRQVGEALAARGPMLVLLDNVEHLLDATGEQVVAWRTLAPDTRFLLTSREPVSVSGERVVPVPPLPEPDAIALIRERAERRTPGCLAHASDRDLAVLVSRLECLPLALELAATRLAVLGPAELLGRLSAPLDVLVSTDRDRPDRHRTMRNTVSWSWSLLSPRQQRCLAHLCAFAGPVALADVEGVVLPESGARDLVLQELLERSLVRPVEVGPRRRFGLFDVVRSYVMERLPDEVAAARVRHGRWLAGRVSHWLDTYARERDEAAIQALHDYEVELLAALSRDQPGPVRKVLALGQSVGARYRGSEVQRRLWLDEAWVLRESSDALHDFLLLETAQAAWLGGRVALAVERLDTPSEGRGVGWARRALLRAEIDLAQGRLAEATARLDRIDREGEALPIWLGLCVRVLRARAIAHGGDTDAGIREMRRVHLAFGEVGDGIGERWSAAVLGVLLQSSGRHGESVRLFEGLARSYAAARNGSSEGHALAQLAHALSAQGQVDRAEPVFHRAIRTLSLAGAGQTLGITWLQLAWMHLQVGAYEQASEALDRAGALLGEADNVSRLRYVQADRALVLAAAGEVEASIEALERVVAAFPARAKDVAAYHGALALLSARIGRKAQAESWRAHALLEGLSEAAQAVLGRAMDGAAEVEISQDAPAEARVLCALYAAL